MARVRLISLLVTTILLTPGVIAGQEAHVGIRAGLSVVQYSLPNLSEDWRSGGVVAAFVHLPVHEYLSLQGELAWVEKGARWFKEGWGPTRALLDYGEAGTYLRFSVPLVGGLSATGLGGGWLSRLVACSGDAPSDSGDCSLVFGEISPLMSDTDCSTDGMPVNNDCGVMFREGDYRRMDLGWTLGFGLNLERGPWISMLEVRWSRGLRGILEERPQDNPSTRSTQLTLALGRRLAFR